VVSILRGDEIIFHLVLVGQGKCEEYVVHFTPPSATIGCMVDLEDLVDYLVHFFVYAQGSSFSQVLSICLKPFFIATHLVAFVLNHIFVSHGEDSMIDWNI